MRVIAKPALVHFGERHPGAKGPLSAWHAVMREREYLSPNQLKAEFGSASILGDGYVVFNIGGNRYRLLVHIRYDLGIVFVKRALTHEEYDRLIETGALIPGRNENG